MKLRGSRAGHRPNRSGSFAKGGLPWSCRNEEDHLRLDSAWVLVTRKDPPGDEQILWIGDLPDQPAASVTAAPSPAEADVLAQSRPEPAVVGLPDVQYGCPRHPVRLQGLASDRRLASPGAGGRSLERSRRTVIEPVDDIDAPGIVGNRTQSDWAVLPRDPALESTVGQRIAGPIGDRHDGVLRAAARICQRFRGRRPPEESKGRAAGS